jgi:hypothetical protein
MNHRQKPHGDRQNGMGFFRQVCEVQPAGAPAPGSQDQVYGPGPGHQVPVPGSFALRIPTATSGRIPILT